MQAEWEWLIPLFVITLAFFGCTLFVYFGELYRFDPDWGPVRKFDSSGKEDLGINQLLIHRHLERTRAEAATAKQEENYGSIGVPTWGVIEAPWQKRELMWDPNLKQEVYVKRGFTDTQYLRAHSTWWGRDEPTYIQNAGLAAPALTVNDFCGDLVQQRMAV
mmetsp:Transcript_97731/g.248357  ORF Transcript_97731/g.248357 Transcript_97731/m.248357 type:complete len:162 (-) Transcript_97731:119-604(-)